MNDRAAPPPPMSPPKSPQAHRSAPQAADSLAADSLAADSLADRLAAFAATPVFEVEREERLEALATTGRGPRRLAAAVMLAADTRRANLRARRTSRRSDDRPAEPPATIEEPALTEPTPPAAPQAKRQARAAAPKTKRQARAARPTPTAKQAAATPKAARPPRAARTDSTSKQPVASPATRAMTAARLRRARTAHQIRLLNSIDPAERVADDAAWERWVSTEPEPDGDDALAKLHEDDRSSGRLTRRADQPGGAGQSGRESKVRPWRQRASQALDRLAEREVERGARLEEAVVPKRHDAWAGPARRRSKAS